MRKILILIIPLTILLGCKNNNFITVDGTIKKNSRDYITISSIEVTSKTFIDSVKIGKKGHFKFRVKASEPDFYQVGFTSTNFITLLAEPGERIRPHF